MYEDPHRHIIFYPCSFRFPQENILTHTHTLFPIIPTSTTTRSPEKTKHVKILMATEPTNQLHAYAPRNILHKEGKG